MSDSSYKVVTKVNVTLQIEVQPFNGTVTLDEIDKAASKEAIEIARKMIRDYNPGGGKMAICGDPSVFSILVKDVKQ
jgi:hypothetical protein